MEPKVAILLAYYNAEEYFAEQLYSVLGQSYKNLHIFIIDDCSDQPLDLQKLNLSEQDLAKITVRRNAKNLGLFANVYTNLAFIDDSFEFVSFCDSDDVWLEHKVSRAVEYLQSCDNSKPNLYHSNFILVDQDLKIRDTWHNKLANSKFLSKLHCKYKNLLLCFNNAMVENCVIGPSIVINIVAKKILLKAFNNIINDYDRIIPQDWFAYQIISGVGGKIYFDADALFLYRRHGKSLSSGCFEQKLPVLNFLKQMYCYIIGNNERKYYIGGYDKKLLINHLKMLYINSNLLTLKNQKKLAYFISAGQCNNILLRLYYIIRAGVYSIHFIKAPVLFCCLLFTKLDNSFIKKN